MCQYYYVLIENICMENNIIVKLMIKFIRSLLDMRETLIS